MAIIPFSFLVTSKVPTSKANSRLEFVHIPKTGGTAIERTAASQNISWSYCHFVRPPKHYFCPLYDKYRSLNNPKHFPLGVPHWHLPPRYFEYKPFGYPLNPYENATLFAIVRNPYERVISHYFYSHGELANIKEARLNNPGRLNGFLRKHLSGLQYTKKKVEIGDNPTNNTVKLGDSEYYKRSGHLIPQYDYVYDGEKRMVEHVLYFETLYEKFPPLMKAYGLDNVVLTKEDKGKGGSEVKFRKLLGVGNLTLDNIRLIERVYARDFAAFGYKTIISNTSHNIMMRKNQFQQLQQNKVQPKIYDANYTGES